MPYVVVSIGGEELSRHPLVGPTIIGRSVDADVSIRDASMSRWHCKIEQAGDPANVWTITDLGSRNGTTLNGRKVSRHVLHHGDMLRVGRVTVAFVVGEFVAEKAKTGGVPRSSRPSQPNVSIRAKGFAKPLFVPESRLPRPNPTSPDGKRTASAAGPDLEMMSSPGWSRQAGKQPPAPSVDLSPGELSPPDRAKTVDLLNVPVETAGGEEVVAPTPKRGLVRRVWDWLSGR